MEVEVGQTHAGGGSGGGCGDGGGSGHRGGWRLQQAGAQMDFGFEGNGATRQRGGAGAPPPLNNGAGHTSGGGALAHWHGQLWAVVGA
jgi:hypothetical protein